MSDAVVTGPAGARSATSLDKVKAEYGVEYWFRCPSSWLFDTINPAPADHQRPPLESSNIAFVSQFLDAFPGEQGAQMLRTWLNLDIGSRFQETLGRVIALELEEVTVRDDWVDRHNPTLDELNRRYPRKFKTKDGHTRIGFSKLVSDIPGVVIDPNEPVIVQAFVHNTPPHLMVRFYLTYRSFLPLFMTRALIQFTFVYAAIIRRRASRSKWRHAEVERLGSLRKTVCA